MAGVLQAEKQLFEKFWQGTFKAVAMPRPESIIVASITARRAVTKMETPVTPKDDEKKEKTTDTLTKSLEKHAPLKRRGHKRSHRRVRSGSIDDDLSPWPLPKTKKKKKKSQRKRRRHRSPSCSPSPVRKKKKKKSSKKRKRHRSASRKGRHRGSSSRRKKREDKKHKKRSGSHSHRRHRRRKAAIRNPSWLENRSEDYEKSGFQHGGHSSGASRGDACGSAIRLTSKISSKCCCQVSQNTVSPSLPGVEGLNKMITQDSKAIKGKGHPDYDSGNDTSSPPSSKAGITRSKVTGNGKFSCLDSTCAENLRLADGGNASDSGNSLTSYDSLGKPVLREHTLHSSVFCKLQSGETNRNCENTQPLGTDSDRNRSPSSDGYQERGSRSHSRSVSSQSRYSGHHSKSRSLSTRRRSYSRSSRFTPDSRRDSVSSLSTCYTSSYSRSTTNRCRKRKRYCSCCKSRKHSRRRPSPPMRKRRRDSPSHLEARRITSARKRPVPYYRPSPSVSSRSSSILSWRLFALNRSRTRSPSRSPTRSRSSSYSSYRSYSRSSSWNSAYSRRSRSRSRSYDSVVSYSRAHR